MYHFRAAMQILNYSVVLYDSNTNTASLEDYLKRSALENKKHIWVVPWKWDTFKNATKPASFTGCSLDGEAVTEGKDVERRKLTIHSENNSTRVIAKQDTFPTKVSKNMAILTDDSKKTLGSQFESLFKNKWNFKPDSSTILSLHRNTGTKGGVYPELDTGDALSEIYEIVKKIPAKDSKSFRTISCGNKDAISGIPSIGEYWADLTLTVPTGETARDVEAYFLEWAFEKNYYQMAIGFRSGALDLFAFLGTPTVSIGLRNMIGEFRHELLAKEAFKRVNVQYDQPRHNATAYIKPKIKDSLPQLSSPFWSGDAPDGVKKRDAGNDDDKRRQQAKKPSSFTAFDKIVLEGIGANPTRTHTARYYYPTGLTDDKKVQKLDTGDIGARKKKRDILQESDKLFQPYQDYSKRDSVDIHGILGDQDVVE
ncbi:MAG: hypothetical protein M1822_004459 [Bathelium mastoideum]|nr:MAG: hypothetical protein M1822_004459 [Bathelium mastoideum]